MKLPSSITTLSDLLIDAGAHPVLVGGYVRDHFLGLESKDIDIEVFGIDSLDTLKTKLSLLAPVHDVGKSFGVLKLSYEEHEFDISLPRTEIKTAKGHTGFSIKTDGHLDFKTAASRRDFTMNAIGFDLVKNEFLDPFDGISDIKAKCIRHVSDESFAEDPLRVLRAMQFCARFRFKLDTNTLTLCKNMVQDRLLLELPKERIFSEYEKLLKKANTPSLGLKFLYETGALSSELKRLSDDAFSRLLKRVDIMAGLIDKKDENRLVLMLASLSVSLLDPSRFLCELSDHRSLIDDVLKLSEYYQRPLELFEKGINQSDVLRLSLKVNIRQLVLLAKADYLASNTDTDEFEAGQVLLDIAKNLGVSETPLKPLIQGRDLINRGLSAGKEFKTILDAAFEAQLNQEFDDQDSAQTWLDGYLFA